jgi:chromosome segregation ATPase
MKTKEEIFKQVGIFHGDMAWDEVSKADVSKCMDMHADQENAELRRELEDLQKAIGGYDEKVSENYQLYKETLEELKKAKAIISKAELDPSIYYDNVLSITRFRLDEAREEISSCDKVIKKLNAELSELKAREKEMGTVLKDAYTTITSRTHWLDELSVKERIEALLLTTK